MGNHPIDSMMENTLEKIRQMTDSNTIVGNPINCVDGTIIIPISKVSYGFASGGSDLPTKTDKELFGGGAGAGVTISPVAFITISNGNTKLLQIDPFNSSLDRAIGLAPDLIDKISGLFNKKGEKKENSSIQAEKPELVKEQQIEDMKK